MRVKTIKDKSLFPQSPTVPGFFLHRQKCHFKKANEIALFQLLSSDCVCWTSVLWQPEVQTYAQQGSQHTQEQEGPMGRASVTHGYLGGVHALLFPLTFLTCFFSSTCSSFLPLPIKDLFCEWAGLWVMFCFENVLNTNNRE